ncbi:hypothetical protein C8R44DRAFT_857994 [Mycena epipterygia]|nr:hypothetical protein C8R44DRAFT_857994 [Mycena epipterygia]
MDDETYSNREFRYTGAFFPRSKNCSISGGTFTSVTNHNTTVTTVPSDFRRIPWGEVDLRREIHLNNRSGVVHRQRGRAMVHRMYSAKIDGREGEMTVSVYEGETAEEEWRQEISKYSRLRHPNVVQIFGAASSSDIHAVVFHDAIRGFPDGVIELLIMSSEWSRNWLYMYYLREKKYLDVRIGGSYVREA